MKILVIVVLALTLAGSSSFALSTVRPAPLLPGSPEDNPIATLRGAIIEGKLLGDEDRGFLNVRFSLYGRSLFEDQSILFCGGKDVVAVAQRFDGMGGAIEVRYEKVAHETFEGLGCHNLISVKHWGVK